MLPLLTLALTAAAAAAAQSLPKMTATDCSALSRPTVPDATVVSMQAMMMTDMLVPMAGGTTMPLSFCDVNVTLTHGTAGDNVRIEVWMPLAGSWNGRFQGTGGSGYSAGLFDLAMGPAVMDGYAAASTDAGVGTSGNFTLAADGGPASPELTQQLLTNFANLSIHEMAVVGKALVQQFYGMPANRSYFTGCSTGGRQGLMEAQRFPGDFDGIVAASPAINWDRLMPAELWPFSVMQAAGEMVPACVLNTLTAGMVSACDELDGVRDGMLANPGACTFDPATLVGTSAAGCAAASSNGTSAGANTTITASQAAIFTKILAGPTSPAGDQLWYGLLPGTSPTTLAANGQPFVLGATWLSNFVLALNPNSSESAESVNTALASQQAYTNIFEQSQTLFDGVIGTDDPDLTAFQRSGGKLIAWHGLADQLVFANGTFDYVQRVMDLMGATNATSAVDGFLRAFAAPGVQHCGGGSGAVPTDPLAALVAWVENGTAPDTLAAMSAMTTTMATNMTGMSANDTTATPANATMITRNLCRYPQMLMYSGSGNASLADSWMCMPGPNQKVISETTLSQSSTRVLAETSGAGALSRGAGIAVAGLVALYLLM